MIVPGFLVLARLPARSTPALAINHIKNSATGR